MFLHSNSINSKSFILKKTKMKEAIIFFLSIRHQIWRRYFYLFNKRNVFRVYRKRKGVCKRCGGCCNASFKCSNLKYDENGLSCCKVNDNKPMLCRLYPYSKKDFFKHLRRDCGYRYH